MSLSGYIPLGQPVPEAVYSLVSFEIVVLLQQQPLGACWHCGRSVCGCNVCSQHGCSTMCCETGVLTAQKRCWHYIGTSWNLQAE